MHLGGNRRWVPSRGGYSHTLPIRVCVAQRVRDFEAPYLERGIHFRGVFWNGVRCFERTKAPVL